MARGKQHWREYQRQVAAFFDTLGFTTEVEANVEGVRSIHEVDVWVVGELHGIRVQWAVECKAWKTKIPKEKVLALQSLVEDVGADRGFLVTEVGFQPAAIDAAKVSNIVLCTLPELKIMTNDYLTKSGLEDLGLRATRLLSRMSDLVIVKSASGRGSTTSARPGGPELRQYLEMFGRVSLAESAIQRSLAGIHPVVYSWDSNETPLVAANENELFERTPAIVGEAEVWVECQEAAIDAADG